MKVFTVGLDDKERSLKADEEKSKPIKVEMPVTAPPPLIIPNAAPKRRFGGCGVLTWVIAGFFVVLLCLTISEITYNRQRDQAFLALKWAELRQRMLGFQILSHAQQQAQGKVREPVNELPAFPRRFDLIEEPTKTTTMAVTTSSQPSETSTEGNDNEFSHRFDLLRMILSKLRENAEEMGGAGDMQVHVIEVKPLPNKMSQQSIDDAFGEVAIPKQAFGPWQSEEAYNELHSNNIELPWQFDRESSRPSSWNHPAHRSNQWEGPQEPRWPLENQVLLPVWDAPEEEPQAKMPHYFEKEVPMPQRFVTEPFGISAPEVIGHLLGQKNAQAQLQFQQQQMQQQQWPQPWPQNPAQQWPQPQQWPQVPVWDQRWDQPQPAQAPVVWPVYFNQVPQQQPQFQQFPPPPPPFQPSIGQQNQFPFPAQNQVPIFPQPIFADVNNNNNFNTLNDNPTNQKPWYMNGNDQKWAQTWDYFNANKLDSSFNPHPAAVSPSWVENTVAVEPQPMVSQVTAEQTVGQTGRDSDGIDGFQKEEKFNVPLDMTSDAASQTVNVDAEPPAHVDAPVVNAWQHAQPQAAEDAVPASAPVVPNPSLGSGEDRSFLPVRGNEEAMVSQPMNDAQKNDEAVMLDDFPKKVEAPLFQVDDPANFR